MAALKAGSRMRWMDMFTPEEAHLVPSALLILRTEADVTAVLPLVRAVVLYCYLVATLNKSPTAVQSLLPNVPHD